MEYALHVLTMVAIFGILAVSFNVVIGYAGLFSIAPAAFYGIGAYAVALLTLRLSWTFLPSLVGAMLVAMVISLALASASVRVSGEYLAIASYGFQVIVFSVFNNWDDVTRRRARHPRHSRRARWRLRPQSHRTADRRVGRARHDHTCHLAVHAWRVGRLLRAMRDDEIAARALGKDVTRAKVVAFGIASMGAACAGGFFAHHLHYIDPTSFTFDTSMLVLSMVIVGGSGYVLGPLIGAGVLTVLPEVLRLIQLPGSLVGPLEQIAYAVLLLLTLRVRPRGLASLVRARLA